MGVICFQFVLIFFVILMNFGTQNVLNIRAHVLCIHPHDVHLIEAEAPARAGYGK